MKFIFLSILFMFLISCQFNHESDELAKNINISVNNIRLYKGYIIVNDSLCVGGGYFKKSKSFDFNTDRIYGDLLVGDSLNTGQSPKKYIIRTRDNIQTKFFRHSYLDK